MAEASALSTRLAFPPPTVLSEALVVRETLCALLGGRPGAISLPAGVPCRLFALRDGIFSVRQRYASMSGCSASTLQSLLERFVAGASDLQAVRSFTWSGGGAECAREGFQWGLRTLVSSWETEIGSLESHFSRLEYSSTQSYAQEEVGSLLDPDFLERCLRASPPESAMTLLDLCAALLPLFSRATALAAFLAALDPARNLLDMLYNRLRSADADVVLLFNAALSPLLELLRSWLNDGARLDLKASWDAGMPSFLAALRPSVDSVHFFLTIVHQQQSLEQQKHTSIVQNLTQRPLAPFVAFDGSQPVRVYVEERVMASVLERTRYIHSQFVQLLIDHFHLDRVFTVLRDVFLGKHEILLLDFTNALFQSFCTQSFLPTSTELTARLRQSMRAELPHYPHAPFLDLMQYSVRYELVEGARNQSVEVLDALTVVCDVPYPLNIVLRPSLMSELSSIQRLLLKFKRVVYDLNELHKELRRWYNVLQTDSNTPRLFPDFSRDFHAVQLKSTVISRHVHMLYTGVLDLALATPPEKVVERLRATQNIQEMEEYLGSFVGGLQDQLLLRPKQRKLMRALLGVLNHGLQFVDWFRSWTQYLFRQAGLERHVTQPPAPGETGDRFIDYPRLLARIEEESQKVNQSFNFFIVACRAVSSVRSSFPFE